MEIGQVLNFIPPELDGDLNSELKRRYMLIIDNDIEKNIIKLLNISKIKGKERKMVYDSNLPMKEDYYPFTQPSFVKLKTTYEIENFGELSNYISYKGEKVTKQQFEAIIQEKQKYSDKHKDCNTIIIEKEEFFKINMKTNLMYNS